MKILARHKWVEGATITESVDEKKEGYKDVSFRRFTATVRGWRNFKIWEGYLYNGIAQKVIKCVEEIKDRIDRNDDSVFLVEGYFIKQRKERANCQ